MPAEGEAVVEDRVPVQERLGDAVCGDHGAHRGIGRGHALGGRDDVGLRAVALAPEPVPEAPPRADHLVGDEQDFVAVADLAHPLEVAVLGHEAATAVLDRLEDHRGDRVGTLEQNRLLDRVGRPQGIALFGPAVGVGVGHVPAARRERLERFAQRRQARSCERPHRSAVVGKVARNDLVLAWLAAGGVIGLGELPGGLDRLRAAGHEEDPVQIAGRELGDARGQFDRTRVGVAPVRIEAELLGLLGRGFAQLGATVADVHAVQRRQSVEIALAVRVVHVAALTAFDDRNLGALLIGAHAREVHPQVTLGKRLQIGCPSRSRTGHRSRP